ncbi:MAG: hypothetical protein HKM95_15160 [Inquilinus sp.]|nr:hypothetical protein [Inquilinus sp.]
MRLNLVEAGARRRANRTRQRGHRARFRPVPPAANDNRHRLQQAIGGLLAIAVSAILAVAVVLLFSG